MSSDGLPSYDGDFTVRVQTGPTRPVYLEETDSYSYYTPFCIRAANYRPTTRGSVLGRAPGYVVDETETRVLGGDVLEWEIVTAEVPRTRTVPVPYVYPYQLITTTSSGHLGDSGGSASVTLAELPIPTVAEVTYDYFLTANPSGIPLGQAFKAAQVGESIYYLGNIPGPNPVKILAEDDQLRRWRGNIWERTRTQINFRKLTQK